MIKLFYKCIILGSLILISQPSFALAKFGHKVVCQLSFEHLSTAKQQRITQLLHAVPRTHQTIINKYNRLDANAPLTFANACTWADAIKYDSEESYKYKQYKSWHYLNVPRDLTSINKPMCSKNCLPQAIITHQKQLQSQPRSWQSAQALLFLSHWLGDIHQPLHISYASDLGGNKVAIEVKKSSCKDLHSYWDFCLMKTIRRSEKQWVERLSSMWGDIEVPSFYPQQVWWWADESYQIIREPTFQYCHLTSQKACLQPDGKVTLSSDYSRKHFPLLQMQLLKAAKRLTRILEQSL